MSTRKQKSTTSPDAAATQPTPSLSFSPTRDNGPLGGAMEIRDGDDVIGVVFPSTGVSAAYVLQAIRNDAHAYTAAARRYYAEGILHGVSDGDRLKLFNHFLGIAYHENALGDLTNEQLDEISALLRGKRDSPAYNYARGVLHGVDQKEADRLLAELGITEDYSYAQDDDMAQLLAAAVHARKEIQLATLEKERRAKALDAVDEIHTSLGKAKAVVDLMGSVDDALLLKETMSFSGMCVVDHIDKALNTLDEVWR